MANEAKFTNKVTTVKIFGSCNHTLWHPMLETESLSSFDRRMRNTLCDYCYNLHQIAWNTKNIKHLQLEQFLEVLQKRIIFPQVQLEDLEPVLPPITDLWIEDSLKFTLELFIGYYRYWNLDDDSTPKTRFNLLTQEDLRIIQSRLLYVLDFDRREFTPEALLLLSSIELWEEILYCDLTDHAIKTFPGIYKLLNVKKYPWSFANPVVIKTSSGKLLGTFAIA